MEDKIERYCAIDGLRAFACIAIVLMHIEVNLNVIPTYTALTNNIIEYAGEFVLLFMMISAFSLNCGYYYKFLDGNIKVQDFYKRRYARILPFFALITFIDVLKSIVEVHFQLSETLGGTLIEALCNLTLMYGFIPINNIEVVGVGWFLGVIFIFYLCYPFFIYLTENKKKAWIAFVTSVFLAIVSLYYFLPVKGSPIGNPGKSFVCCTPFFMSGGLVYLYRKSIINLQKKNSTKAALLVCTIAYSVWFFVYPEKRFSLSNLIMFSLWLVYAVSTSGNRKKITFLKNKFAAFLSRISLEIYLCHMMFFRIFGWFHLDYFIHNRVAFFWTYSLLTLGGSILFAWGWKKWGEPKVLNFLITTNSER